MTTDTSLVRDERWENVRARMGPRSDYYPDELEMGVDISKYFTIEIDVFYQDHHFWQYQSLVKEDIPDFKFDVISWLLNEMIARIDDDMDRLCPHAE